MLELEEIDALMVRREHKRSRVEKRREERGT
jgi:hypothetical protein